nr:S-layer homology domain-containing protein [Oscillospiraceae bacterium]
AKAGETVTVTPKADEGYTLADLIVKDSKGNVISTAKNADGTYSFVMPTSGKVTVTPVFEKESAPKFVDVPENSFYADAVDWAVANGVTTGTSETTFSPDGACTRAEAVTFLYRAAGAPEVELSTVFTDVAADAYYAKAVAWAVANGITKGTSETTFSPDAICSRAQIVTFLYRFAKGSPASNTFKDVPTDAYYSSAVGWAVANGITKGTGKGTTFSPNDDCLRSQIVTFLYRNFNK